MALDVENVVDCRMRREKSLRGSDAFEPLHLPLPSFFCFYSAVDKLDDIILALSHDVW